MNEFTKDELELFRDYELEVNAKSPLYIKIQSLINNYCEHEMRETIVSYPNYICNKCGYEP